MNEKKYKGFEEELTAAEWAKKLNMDADLFLYSVETCRLNVEELYRIRGAKYEAPKTKGPGKEKHMNDARRWAELILAPSGCMAVDDIDNPETLELVVVPGSPSYVVRLHGETVGRFFYKERRMVIADEGVPLDKIDLDDLAAVKTPDGWRWSDRTHIANVNRYLAELAAKNNEN